jgi:hypothetical protein
MWLAIWTLIKRPQVLLGLLVTTAVLSAFAWYGAHREAQGYQHGSVDQLKTDKDQFNQVLKQYDDKLQQAQAVINADDIKLSTIDSQLKTLQVQYQGLALQRQQASQSIQSLPDAAVQGDLETKLGGPLSSPTVLRKADSIVSDYPLVLKQVDIANANIASLNAKVDVINDKVTQITKQRDAAIDFGNQVVGYYVKAYNAAQIHHSRFIKIVTFGLVHDKHLDLPSPTSLNVQTANRLPSR